MSSFTSDLVVSPVDDRWWRLVQGFSYYTDLGKDLDLAACPGMTKDDQDRWVVTIGAGFESDWASIPRPFWSILPPWGRYGKAALVHDWLYTYRIGSRLFADDVLREAMIISKVPAWKIWCIYNSVRWFGWLFYPKVPR